MQKVRALLCLVLASAASSTGCTVCRNEYLYDYGGVGGKWQRTNPACGRVGSNLSDAGAYQAGTGIEMGANYGDSWNLIEGEQAPDDAPMFMDGELIEADPAPDDGAIMIGP